MEDVAEAVSERLQEEVDTALIGVSYYDGEEIGHVYRSEWAAEKYDPEEIDAIVEDLRLASLGHGAQEQLQRERLHATVRVYDELLDIDVPVRELHGVAVALDKAGDYRTRDVISAIEDVVEANRVDESAG